VPSLLISIKKSRWHSRTLPTYKGSPDVPADSLYDLRVEGNELSVWQLPDDRSNLERVLTALSATRDFPSNIDYLLFDSRLPNAFDIGIKQSSGGTPDVEANKRWHYDLHDLSGRQLAEFAVALHQSGERRRELEKRVKQLITMGVQNSHLTVGKINPKLAQKLQLGQPPTSRWERLKGLFKRTS
jgi:hypothetical protein